MVRQQKRGEALQRRLWSQRREEGLGQLGGALQRAAVYSWRGVLGRLREEQVAWWEGWGSWAENANL